jgi:hypothetical protein
MYLTIFQVHYIAVTLEIMLLKRCFQHTLNNFRVEDTFCCHWSP